MGRGQRMADLRVVLKTQGLRNLVIPPKAGEEKTLMTPSSRGGQFRSVTGLWEDADER